MRVISRIDKKGISNLIAYVLLISLTLSISVVVYGWLVGFANPGDIEVCPSGTNLVIKDYSCDFDGRKIELVIQNKGRFTVDGFYLRGHNSTNATLGLYNIFSGIEEISPGDILTKEYSWPASSVMSGSLTFLEIQPFVEGKNRVLCDDVIRMKINCTDD